VAFQFQDRVSQILSHVKEDFDHLLKQIGDCAQLRLAGELTALDIDSAVAHIAAGYTTDEERENHGADVSNVDMSAGENELTFF